MSSSISFCQETTYPGGGCFSGAFSGGFPGFYGGALALARALARSPKLLVLDEPVSALDEPTRREICQVIRAVQRKFQVATLHVCHNLEEARLVADRVGIMADGRLVQTGTLKELADDPAEDTVRRLLFLTDRSKAPGSGSGPA